MIFRARDAGPAPKGTPPASLPKRRPAASAFASDIPHALKKEGWSSGAGCGMLEKTTEQGGAFL